MEADKYQFQTKYGWVMVFRDGRIWLETFSATKIMARAKAVEYWALNNELPKDHPGCIPMYGVMTVVLSKTSAK